MNGGSGRYVAPVPCPATAMLPPGDCERTGYPTDTLGRCVRISGHEGDHFAAMPMANAPGSVTFSWPPADDPEQAR